MAYCLLGLFDVNMPLLYGEGLPKAFRRLQIQIMSNSYNESLFAWQLDQPASGMLAATPDCFADAGGIVKKDNAKRTFRRAYSMSNIGLKFPISSYLPDQGLIPLKLNCYDPTKSADINPIYIQLRLQDSIAVRTRCQILNTFKYPKRYESAYQKDLSNEDF